MRKRTWLTAFFLTAMTGCSSDFADSTAEDCGPGEKRTFEGEEYCVYSGPIIETRFTCPQGFPERHEFEDSIVCTRDGSVPPNFATPDPWVVDELGDFNPEPPVDDSDEPADNNSAPCDFGFEASCPERLTPPVTPEIIADVIWWGGPDEELLRAETEGELATRTGVARHVSRLLEKPRARILAQGLSDFWERYLGIDSLGSRSDSPEFPEGSEHLSRPMADSTVLTIHEVTLTDGADTRSIFSTKTLVANRDIAALFEMSAAGSDFERLTIPAGEDRAGVLSHPSFIAATSADQTPFITRRGGAIRQLMCQGVPGLPNEPKVLPEVPDGTTRDQLEEMTASAECATCHNYLDPHSFALEDFDMLGRPRSTDNGFPIDTTGELDGVQLSGATDLGTAMANDPRVSACLARKLARYTLLLEVEEPLPGLDEDAFTAALEAHWASRGYKFEDLLVAILTSNYVRNMNR